MSPHADAAGTPPADGGGQPSVAGPIPTPSLPKGGGAIRGIGEQFAVNPATGTAGLTIPLPASPARSELTPQLALTYDSGAGNGPFGLGWQLGAAAIARKTDAGLPQYDDARESDVFMIGDAEDLVPVEQRTRERDGRTYRVDRYRPRTDTLHARIERWTDEDSGDSHWRMISSENVTTLYGTGPDSRIAEPSPGRRVFAWLAAASHDDRGNALLYVYKREDADRVDVTSAHEGNRSPGDRTAQLYLKRVLYGNRKPYVPGENLAERTDWMFEVVFDYGEHYSEDADGRPLRVTTDDDPEHPWQPRDDPFSSCRPGFELRTYRLCRNVLLFHRFPNELGTPECLVRAAHLAYEETSVASFLTGVTHSGFKRRADGSYLKRSLPPVELTYAKAELHTEVEDAEAGSLADLPGAAELEWVDLDGDGVAGALVDSGAAAWFYKRNLSPIADGAARLAPLRLVDPVPSAARATDERWSWIDLAGDGQPDLVRLAARGSGFHPRAGDGGWEPFAAFASAPAIEFDSDHPPRLVDLTGDGFPDLLTLDEAAIRWHPSLGAEGFDRERRALHAGADEERGPRLVLADRTRAIYLADMSGDGLADLVGVRNGEVAYWPNRGYGRFGPKVTLDGSPWFDEPEEFDAARVQLGDVDGSGPADVVYVRADGVHLYANQSGNALAEPEQIAAYPQSGSTQLMDLLGNGTSCLVWSSSLPGDQGRQLRYIDLMGGVKPHLLTGYENNLGAETSIEYAPSTRFALEDSLAGRPWATRLPFPVHVVDRVELRDRIARTRFVTSYSYHHGYYDGVERAFHGFGMVEQRDSEAHDPDAPHEQASNWGADSWTPPIKTRTWFHTGAFLEAETVSRQYVHEYWIEPALRPDERAADREAMLLADTVLPPDLSPGETREAYRALRGRLLRTELFAEDGSPRSEHPYSLTEQNYTVRRLEPRGSRRHAVFGIHPRESVTFNYERRSDDPRVTHELALETDDFGNLLLGASVAYGRRAGAPLADVDPAVRPLLARDQACTHVSAVQSRFTATESAPDSYRVPRPAETIGTEILGVAPAAHRPGITNLFTFEELHTTLTDLAGGAHDMPYEVLDAAAVDGSPAAPSAPRRRIIERTRTLYRRDDLTGLLPLGISGPRALPGEIYRRVLTQTQVERIFGAAQAPDAVLEEGGYMKIEGDWWRRSGRVFYSPSPTAAPAAELAEAQAHFYLPRCTVDSFDGIRTVTYDGHDLLAVATTDAIRNVTRIDHDYRVLMPLRQTDADGNRSEVAFDVLGLVAGRAVMGKAGETDGDSLTGFQPDLDDEVTQAHAANPLADPGAVLASATERVIYDLHAFHDTKHEADPDPTFAYLLSRETHVCDLGADQESRYQHLFCYSDGFAREVQRKALAAPAGGTQQWVGSAWTIFDNKGRSARTYEPFFAPTHRFQFAEKVGVATTLLYDPAGRLVGTFHPDGTWTKELFDSWRSERWDAVDTCSVSDPRTDPDIGERLRRVIGPGAFTSWHDARSGGALGATAAERAANKDAAEKSAANAKTPNVTHFDARDRASLTVADNGPRGRAADRLAFDAAGRSVALTDPLGRRAQEWCLRELGAAGVRYISGYDLDGNIVYTNMLDGGERRTLFNAAGKAYRSWDARGHAFRVLYDSEQRVTHRYVATAGGVEILLERSIYGEGRSPVGNHAGRLYRHYDGSGLVTYARYDFKGNAIATERRVASAYRTTIDWSPLALAVTDADLDVAAAPLLGEPYSSSDIYDAADRVVQSVTPHRPGMRPNVIATGFDQGGSVARVDVWIRRAQAPAALLDPATADLHALTGATYNARGQRTAASFGNGVVTTGEFDEITFRLTRVRTTRDNVFPAGERVVQEMALTYDAVGNVTRIRDDAEIQGAVIFRNQLVEPTADFTHDALYHLVGAQGREHLGQGGPKPPTHDDREHTVVLAANDAQVMARYSEIFTYDLAGNHLSVAHHVGSGGWTRHYAYAEPSRIDPDEIGNRLSATSLPGDPSGGPYSARYEYDEHGNAARMPHLRGMDWDELDRLRATTTQMDAGGTPETTFNVYDSDGRRVRAVTDRRGPAERPGTPFAERIYLGAVEISRKLGPDGAEVKLERETLHVPGIPDRTAIVESRTKGRDRAPARMVRYQHTNHLGSAVLELGVDAELISHEEYLPYGPTAYQAVRSKTDVSKRYRFTGKELDAPTGFYYHGARFYAPWLGRWISCDPAGVSEGSNAYVYCHLRPSTLRDPDGRQATELPQEMPNRPTGRPSMPRGVPEPPSAPRAPPLDSASAGGRSTGGALRSGAARAVGRGRVAGVAGSAGPLAVGVGVFLIIMLVPLNVRTDYTVRYTDPETKADLTFDTYERLDEYKARKQQEKREAPAPEGQPDSAEAPSDVEDEEIREKLDPLREPAKAPGARDPNETVEAPTTEQEHEEVEAAPLGAGWRSVITSHLRSGTPLTNEEKAQLRGEARWKWEQATGKRAPAGAQVHHVIPLEFAHLFPNQDPNDPRNLVLMRELWHQRVHQAMNEYIRSERAARRKITVRKLERMREHFLKGWRTLYTPMK